MWVVVFLPENQQLEKEIPFGNYHFLASKLNLGSVKIDVSEFVMGFA